MASGPAFPDLERSAFFDGQRLLADDLATVIAYQRELHWLHNRTLHGWGIALGLEVVAEIGDRTVRVEPGYALDCRGRDIILARAETDRQVPPVMGEASGDPKEYLLVISYVDDDDLPEAESRSGVCTGGGAVLRTEKPLVRWCDPAASGVRPDVFRPGFDILLASVKVAECQIAELPDRSGRRSLSAPHRPLARGGRTARGGTTWEFFPTSGLPAGVQTHVDTSAGRFVSQPGYSAQLVGSWDVNVGGAALAAGWTQVANATAQGFDFQVHLPRGLFAGGRAINPNAVFSAAGLSALKTQAHWHVHWVGIEN